LPLNPQQLQESVLLDPSLFRFDERAVSALDRPRPCPDAPVRFVSRRTGKVRFQLDALGGGAPPARTSRCKCVYLIVILSGCRGSLIVCRNTASYVFHPVQPFVIAMHHGTGMVTFHFRA
jgi:hypothetical protein